MHHTVVRAISVQQAKEMARFMSHQKMAVDGVVVVEINDPVIRFVISGVTGSGVLARLRDAGRCIVVCDSTASPSRHPPVPLILKYVASA